MIDRLYILAESFNQRILDVRMLGAVYACMASACLLHAKRYVRGQGFKCWPKMLITSRLTCSASIYYRVYLVLAA